MPVRWRAFYAERMSVVDSWRAGIALQPLPAWHLLVGWEEGRYRPQFDYAFMQEPGRNDFLFAESKLQLSYTFGERYAWTAGRPRLIAAAYPQLLLAYAQGWRVGNEGYDYRRLSCESGGLQDIALRARHSRSGRQFDKLVGIKPADYKIELAQSRCVVSDERQFPGYLV